MKLCTRLAVLAAPLTLAALAVPPAASAATTHPTAHKAPLVISHLCLSNAGYLGACATAEGSGGQAQISEGGASLTVSSCGQISGQNVWAYKTQNGLWMHWLSSNGHVTFETDSTNGCSNNADKWIQNPSDARIYSPYNNVNYDLGTNSDQIGSKIFASASPGWNKWSDE